MDKESYSERHFQRSGSAGETEGFAKHSGFLSRGKLLEFNEFGPLPLSKRKNRRYHPRSLNMR